MVDSTGGRVEVEAVSVDVPAGAVQDGERITVSVGEPIGIVEGPYATEIGGRPVRVEHNRALAGPLTLTWRVPELTEAQRATLVLVKWNPGSGAWEPRDVAPTWAGDALTVKADDFSEWNWWANFGQGVGESLGTRVEAPNCTFDQLPRWVQSTVDPDEDLDAAAIRVCFERDKDERVTVRVANNRTFSQQLRMVRGGQTWAWTWPGEEKFGVTATVYNAAKFVFDDDTHVLMPPLHTQAVGIARPAAPGPAFIEASSRVNVLTVLTDASAYAIGRAKIGGTDNPALNALLQVTYECAGKELLDRPDLTDPARIIEVVIRTLGDCSDEIIRPDSEFGARFEQLSRRAIAKAGLPRTAAVQANRAAREISQKFILLTVAELTFYASDQLANAMVGPLSWSIRGRGRPQALGDWTPTCSSYKEDSNRLYRNLALQDEFANTRKELWEFPDFVDAAESAVEPLARCSIAYQNGLAGYLPTSWGDPKAARVVAAAILGSQPVATRKSLLRAVAPAMCRHKSGRLVDGKLPVARIQDGFVELVTEIKPVRADLNRDGGTDTVVVFSCSAGGIGWPNVLAVYGPGTVLLGSVDLGDYVRVDHSTVESMRVSKSGIEVKWISYSGCCTDEGSWVGTLRHEKSRFVMTDVRRR